jgi:DNA-directed RNA polymerase subunit beta'
VGSVHRADAHRGAGHGEVRRHPRRCHHGGARRRAYRLVDPVIIDCKDLDKRPRVSIKDKDGKTAKLPSSDNVARYFIPGRGASRGRRGSGTDRRRRHRQDPRETTKTKDITGGLPRVAELFEARKPKEFAIISEIDGTGLFGKDTKGKRKVVVTPEVGEPREYLIPKGKHISVHEGDSVAPARR